MKNDHRNSLYTISRSGDLRSDPHQALLTQKLIEPRLDQLLGSLRQFRAEFDRQMAPRIKQARKADRAEKEHLEIDAARYPIGHCRPIRDGVLERFRQDPFVRELVEKGVVLRPVFIFLKGSYFQNAIQFGDYYLDPANDTVFPEKPKLDWARIDDLAFENVDSWERFAEVARAYLKVELFPNRLFPIAVPGTPYFAISSSGRIDLLVAQFHLPFKDAVDGMPRVRKIIRSDAWRNKQLPTPYESLLEQRFGINHFDQFPLEFRPSTPQWIEKEILPEFMALREQPEEEVTQVLRTYFDLLQTASKRIHECRIIPPRDRVEQLRAEGILPSAPPSQGSEKIA